MKDDWEEDDDLEEEEEEKNEIPFKTFIQTSLKLMGFIEVIEHIVHHLESNQIQEEDLISN